MMTLDTLHREVRGSPETKRKVRVREKRKLKVLVLKLYKIQTEETHASVCSLWNCHGASSDKVWQYADDVCLFVWGQSVNRLKHVFYSREKCTMNWLEWRSSVSMWWEIQTCQMGGGKKNSRKLKKKTGSKFFFFKHVYIFFHISQYSSWNAEITNTFAMWWTLKNININKSIFKIKFRLHNYWSNVTNELVFLSWPLLYLCVRSGRDHDGVPLNDCRKEVTLLEMCTLLETCHSH